MGARFKRFQGNWFIPKPLMQVTEEALIKFAPLVSCTEAQPLTIQLELMAKTVGCSTNQSQINVLADIEGQIRKGAELSTGERFGLILSVLTLDRPKLAIVGFSNQVYAFIRAREI